ncbi:hypothetical protein ABT093_26005 [Kitasatospora sp. NPDC002551]|uniref:hypothetical protein n=1 Tax=unclassified Kitasatospora TaxID=2633591 RepID=UPI00331C788B
MGLQISALLVAGATALAFFVLVGFLVWALRHARRPVMVLTAVTAVLGALPAILYVMGAMITVPPIR